MSICSRQVFGRDLNRSLAPSVQTSTHRTTGPQRGPLRLAAFWGLVLAWLIGAWSAAHAEVTALSGNKVLWAVTREGAELPIGAVLFTPGEGDVVRFELTLDPAAFKDYFLSMKEFKCLESALEVSCHVPYPYRNPHTITGGNLAWLEHSLLFLYKQPRDFGAKLWNGSYYRLEPHGIVLIGKAQAVDLNHISAPSDTPDVPPYSADLRADVAPQARWIDHLRIE